MAAADVLAVANSALRCSSTSGVQSSLGRADLLHRLTEDFFMLVAKRIEELTLNFHVCEICGSTIDQVPKAPCEVCNSGLTHASIVC